MFACAFPEGTFSNFVPLLIDQPAQPDLVNFGTYIAPRDSENPIRIGFNFDDDIEQLLGFASSSTPFSFNKSSYSFGNGETITPSLGAKSLEEIITEAGSLKKLIDPAAFERNAGVFLQGTIRMTVSQRIEDGQGGTRQCRREESFSVTRFISASNPGSNRVEFGLTSDTSVSKLELRSSLVPANFRISLTASPGSFSTDFRSITYNPRLSTAVSHLATEIGKIEVSVGTGETKTRIGELDAVAHRYKPRSIHIEKAELSSAIERTFPFVSSPVATADSILSIVRSKLLRGEVPAIWVDNNADANVRVSFPQGERDVYGRTDFEVPTEIISQLNEAIASRETSPTEWVRSNVSSAIVELLAVNKDKIIQAEVFTDAIQRDNAFSTSRQVENALANSIINRILHGIGFLGQISDEPEDLFSYDLMENLSKSGLLGKLDGTDTTFLTPGSKAFLKVITGEGRSVLDLGTVSRPGWWVRIGDVPAYDFAVSCIAREFIAQRGIYHDLIETPPTLAPDIEVENTSYNSSVLDFGEAIQHQPSAKITLKVSNVGKANLVISNIVVTGEFSIRPINLPIKLTALQRTEIQIEMSTLTEGGKTGSIAIYSNDPDESPYYIFLRGAVNNPNKQSFLTVMTHGWNPLQRLDPDFVSGPWVSEYTNLMEEYAARNGVSESKSVVKTHVWDSGSGWNDAILDAVVATVALKLQLDGCSFCGIVAAYAISSIPAHKNMSARLAHQAAFDIKDMVEREAAKLVNPQVHLIGHSRGGAVSALASALLSHPTKIAQLTVLDGYSFDWPALSSILADTHIVGIANASRNVNYRVERGLVDVLPELIYQVGTDLGGIVGTELIEYLRIPDIAALFRDWKAPVRAGFDVNETIIGYQPYGVPSNHTNISDLYFHSDTAENSPKSFLIESPIGRWNPNAAGEDGESGPPPLPISESALASITDFYDGGFEQLGREHALRQQLMGLDIGSNPLFIAYQQIVQKSRGPLSSNWKLVGDAQLVSLPDNTLVELTAKSEAPSSIAQLVRIPTDSRAVSLRLTPTLTTSNASLRVLVDGAAIHQQILSGWTAGPLEVALPTDIGELCEITIEVSSVDNVNDASIQVDDIQLIRPMKFSHFSALPGSDATNWSVHVSATANESLNSAAQSVQFFIERNGIPGLQHETDFLAGESNGLTAAGNWEAFLSHDRFPKQGWYMLYARPIGLPADALVASTTIWVGSDYLPFHNRANPLDVVNDSMISPLDALVVLNFLNSNGSVQLNDSWLPVIHFIDVNADGSVSPLDALLIINALNSRSSGEGEIDAILAESGSSLEFDFQFCMINFDELGVKKRSQLARQRIWHS